ncbi:MAG: hypothetical protein ABI318_18565 [Chthoniobacteraceae bacterium]
MSVTLPQPTIPRRRFIRSLSALSLGAGLADSVFAAAEGKDSELFERIESHRPNRLSKLPPDFNDRFGSTHVGGKYCLTEKPFLIEGAERLLSLGTRLGKFWFEPGSPQRGYPFHSEWGTYRTLLDLAQSEYYAQLWKMPFSTFVLEAMSPAEHGWRKADLPDSFYVAVEREYHDLTAHFCRIFRDRAVTVVLQNWEGDWMLRGSDKKWSPPPDDWKERCGQMQRWLAARQAGVANARAKFGSGAKCVVAHAAEVNRVDDAFKGIPTMTRNVLSGVEVDLVSYSAYDGMNGGPLHFRKCIEEIRAHSRTTSLFGPGALAIGEFGIPENASPKRISERYDEALGVMLAANVRYAAHWELYCNEFVTAETKSPISDPNLMRGFWLVKPDGSLSEGGKYFSALWQRAR